MVVRIARSSLSDKRKRHFYSAACVLFVLLIVRIFPLTVAVNQEGNCLLAFKNQLTDPQGYISNWNANDRTPCNWTGVGCDNDEHVDRLVLQNVGLIGQISPELGALSYLKALSLAGNRIVGSIPLQLLEIEGLWKLNLSSNALVGIIPPGIGRLHSLRLLDLSGNSLTGIISPHFFDSCSRLKFISLSSNVLLGSIPSTLGSCAQLNGIDFSSNHLVGGIPNEIGGLPVLTFLSLRYNRLSGSIPMQLGNCRALQYVDLSMNMFSQELPTALLLLQNLTFLDISQNSLSRFFPPEVLYLPSLQSLNASLNYFTGSLPHRTTATNGCTNLQLLDLSSNLFSGTFPSDLTACSNILLLNLSHNQLFSSIPSDISQMKLLHTLDLSFNQLSHVIPAEIQNASQLALIILSNNRIDGSIPAAIGNLQLLQNLQLQNMDLSGNIPPSLARCRFLLELNLANNSLNGTIPSEIHNITYLRSLQLQHNKLHGGIPVEIGGLIHLTRVDLSYNNLSGEIPQSLGALTALRSFNLSYNNLSGLIPRNGILQQFNKSSFVGNPSLCGIPLSLRCVPLVWPAGPALPPSAIYGNRTDAAHVLSNSTIVAIAVAAGVAVGVIVVVVLNVLKATVQSGKRGSNPTELFVLESVPASPDLTAASAAAAAAAGSSGGSGMIVGKLVLFNKMIPSKYENWREGTKALLGKECMIGSGPLGDVYRATVDGGLYMAVKKLRTLGRIQDQDEFERELSGLGNARHVNLARLEGYYWSSSMQLLFSEYVSNGSLYDHLHGTDTRLTLPWSVRLKVALGTARALSYLHHDCKLMHLNLKSTNILLDHGMEPRVCDFGMRRLLPVVDRYVSGGMFESTLGYVAPEMAVHWVESKKLTEKCDVYSYGVILLELATGKKALEWNVNVHNGDGDDGDGDGHDHGDGDGHGHGHGDGDDGMRKNVRNALEKGDIRDCVDSRLSKSGMYSESEVIQVLKLGLICTAQSPVKRPSMAEAVQWLEIVVNDSFASSSSLSH